MPAPPIIRDQTEADLAALHDLVEAAFKGRPYADGNEQFIVAALWASGAATVSLVAEDAGEIVGQAAFSIVLVGGRDVGWHGCGPVAVMPGRQRIGIGSALMRAGLERLRALGSKGCVVVGDPNYYKRFGFDNTPEMFMPEYPPQYFMAISFGGAMPKGAIKFDKAFEVKA